MAGQSQNVQPTVSPYSTVTLKSIHDVDLHKTFNNKRLLDTEMPVVKGIPHIFFTTPMLNLSEANCYQDSYLANMYAFHPSWLSALSYGANNSTANLATSSPFIKLLYNSAVSFEVKDASSKTQEVGETYYGFKLTLPSSNVDSIIGDELSIEFVDWFGLPVLNTIYSWFVYHNKIRRGQLNPTRESIKRRILDYTSSIYYFLTDMDGTTIQYYAKYTGVVPISVPFSQFSTNYNDHDIIKFPVNFVYSFKEDMNPEILTDFNKVANGRALSLEEYYSVVDSFGGNVFNEGNLPVKYLQSPTDDSLTEYNKTGYLRPMVIHGSYVNDKNNVVRQSPDFRLVFTN